MQDGILTKLSSLERLKVLSRSWWYKRLIIILIKVIWNSGCFPKLFTNLSSSKLLICPWYSWIIDGSINFLLRLILPRANLLASVMLHKMILSCWFTIAPFNCTSWRCCNCFAGLCNIISSRSKLTSIVHKASYFRDKDTFALFSTIVHLSGWVYSFIIIIIKLENRCQKSVWDCRNIVTRIPSKFKSLVRISLCA